MILLSRDTFPPFQDRGRARPRPPPHPQPRKLDRQVRAPSQDELQAHCRESVHKGVLAGERKETKHLVLVIATGLFKVFFFFFTLKWAETKF